jgi:hypothetical protein
MMRLLVSALSLLAAACAMTEPPALQSAPNAGNYDPALAARLGADERGMRMYVLVVLKTGPRDAEITGAERAAVFEGHFSNMRRLAAPRAARAV